MAAKNWPKPVLDETLAHEGGWSDHPADPGGATMKGIVLATFRRHHPGATKADLRAISDAEVERIYRVDYWEPVRGPALPSGVDLVTFDAAVNSGPARGARWTQQAVGFTGRDVDGRIGPQTLAAVRAAPATLLVQGATDRRLQFLQGLSTWSVFGRGWGRRVGSVRAKGLQLAQAAPAEILADAARLDETASNDNRGAAASGAGAGGSGIVAFDQAAAIDWTAIAAFGLATLALVAIAAFLAARAGAKHGAADAMREFVDTMEEQGDA